MIGKIILAPGEGMHDAFKATLRENGSPGQEGNEGIVGRFQKAHLATLLSLKHRSQIERKIPLESKVSVLDHDSSHF